MMLYLAAILLASAVTGHIITPIPVMKIDPGIRYNFTSAGAPIRLDVMLEPICPDSATVWPVLKQTAAYYGSDKLDLVIYPFQLPYHRWGHLCTMGLYAIADQQSTQDAFAYLEHLFSVYDTYGSGRTENRSHTEMLDQLANDANIATGIDQNIFKAVINDYSTHSIWSWKLACTRGVAGTPWYYLNGVDLGINYSLTFDEFRSLIDPLLP